VEKSEGCELITPGGCEAIMSEINLILIYMVVRVGYDLFTIHKLSGKKIKFSELGEWLSAFVFFSLMFILIQSGILSSRQLLQLNSINLSELSIILVYICGYEITRYLYFKRHPKYLSDKKYGIFLSYFVFSSAGVILLIMFTFIALYIKLHS
jgi:hypothetical protein